MILFIHIEKSAGTSFNGFLKENINNYLVLKPFPRHGQIFFPEQLKALSNTFPEINGVGGHRIMPYLNYEDILNEGITYITVLRNPIERYLSHFFHHSDRGISQDNILAFLEKEYFHNFMCKKISGKSSATEAIKIINKKKINVLLVDDLSEITKKNSGSSHIKYYHLLEKYSFEINEANKEDLALYEYCKTRFAESDFLKNLSMSENEKTKKLSSIKSRIIQEVFQRIFYLKSKKT